MNTEKYNELRIGAEPKILCEAVDAEVADLKWHDAEREKPKPDAEVLAEVDGYQFAKYTVVKWDGEYWLNHLPKIVKEMPTDGWFGFSKNITVKRWRNIE